MLNNTYTNIIYLNKIGSTILFYSILNSLQNYKNQNIIIFNLSVKTKLGDSGNIDFRHKGKHDF